ncbi:MAG: hypothetical protein ACTSYM_07130 [Candidatus Baldrarchaeia archaeon]
MVKNFFNKPDDVSKLISYLSELGLKVVVEVEDVIKGKVKKLKVASRWTFNPGNYRFLKMNVYLPSDEDLKIDEELGYREKYSLSEASEILRVHPMVLKHAQRLSKRYIIIDNKFYYVGRIIDELEKGVTIDVSHLAKRWEVKEQEAQEILQHIKERMDTTTET